MIFILSLFFWMPVARIIRGLVLSLKEKEFVEAARAVGASDSRIMFRHLVPNCTGQIIINTTLAVAAAILTESALSFLGFGVDGDLHADVGQPAEQLARTCSTSYPSSCGFPGSRSCSRCCA